MQKVLPIIFSLVAIAGPGEIACASNSAGDTTPPPLGEMHVVITVRACLDPNANKPPEPVYPDQQQNTPAEPLPCQDVLIPPEVMQSDMNAAACKSLPGYMASMQFLQQSAQWQGYSVGGWTCSISTTPVASAAQG